MAKSKAVWAMLQSKRDLARLTKEQRVMLAMLRRLARSGQPTFIIVPFSGFGEVTKPPKPPKPEPEPEPAPGPTPEEIRQAEYAAMKAAFEASGLTREQWIARRKAEGVK